MIAKIVENKGRTLKGVVYYNENKKEELLAIGNSYAQDSEQLLTHLEWVAGQNDRVGDPVFHAVISLAQDDVLSTAQLAEVGARYMQEMGYGEQPYGIYLHKDTDSTHIHIVSTVIDCNNFLKINDSYAKRRSYAAICKVSEEYGLQPVLGKRTQVGLVNKLSNQVAQVLKQKPHNFNSLVEYCEAVGLKVERTQKGGYVFFSPLSRKGIKSTELPLFKTKGVDRRLRANKYYRQKAKEKLSRALDQLLLSTGKRYTLREYIGALREAGIYVRVSRNAAQINGLRYSVDGFSLKGVDVGEQYSWNKISPRVAVQLRKVGGAPVRKAKVQQSQSTKRYKPTPLLEGILRDISKVSTAIHIHHDEEEERKEDEQNLDRD